MKTCCKSKNKGRVGFTLIEVLLGVLILTILAVAVPAGLAYPRLLVVSAAHKQAAIHAANEVLEEAFSMNYNSADLSEDTVTLNLGNEYTLNGRAISVSRTVKIMGGAGGHSEYKRITVFVNYPGGDSPVVLETFITP